MKLNVCDVEVGKKSKGTLRDASKAGKIMPKVNAEFPR